MSWVLILNSNYAAKPPAVLGGFPTRGEAEGAGDHALAFEDKPHAAYPYYSRYLVIPGAGCSGPSGTTSVEIDRGEDGKLFRRVLRLPG